MTGIVHVIDDDEGVCDSLKALLELKGYAVLAHTGTIDFLEKFKPDTALCILADLRMPGIGGLELQERMAVIGVDVPFVMITGHGDVPSAVRALKSGAIDFIEKPLEASLVLSAVERASATRRKTVKEAQHKAEARQRLGQLTPRESQVLHLLIQGKSNKIIAFELCISQRTVENHRARLMMKTKAESVAELITLASAAGFANRETLDLHQGIAE